MYDSEFWKTFLTEHYALLQGIVQRRFHVYFSANKARLSGEQARNTEMAEDALPFVSEKLLEDDCRHLKNYDPKRGATEKTYFTVLVQRLLSRFFEETKGRYKPSAWLLKQGHFLLMLVHKHLCWERMPEDDVVEYLKNTASDGRNPLFVREAIQIIREKYPNCGEPRPSMEDEGEHTDGVTPEELLVRRETEKIVRSILLGPEDDDDPSIFPVIRSLQEKINRDFNPTDEQRLFLRMIHQDGMRIIAAGEKLGWSNFKAQGQNRSLRKKLRQLAGDDVRRLFMGDL